MTKQIASYNPIVAATTARCIDEQIEAAGCHVLAERYVAKGLLGRAAQEQREGAYHSEQARIRLDRLNSHA